MTTPRRVLRSVLLSLAAIVLFIEEWGWRPLTAAIAWIARWPPLARLEARIARVSPPVALLLFGVPAVLLFPVKLAALWLIGEGHAGLGLGVIVLAKVAGTALVGRLFMLTERQLMHYTWFARAMGWWRGTKARVRVWLHATAAWRAARRMKALVQRAWRRWRRA